jgi:hypothetical protein
LARRIGIIGDVDSKQKAPISVEAPTGARTAQPKPYRSLNPGIRLSTVKPQQEISQWNAQFATRSVKPTGKTARAINGISAASAARPSMMRRKPLGNMYLSIGNAEQVLRMLLEGNSVSSVERITDVHQGTILKLLVLAAEKCEKIIGRLVVNVKVRDVECDEL